MSRPGHCRRTSGGLVTRAHRAWALEHPSEHLLLYGHTGLRVTPGGNRGIHKAMSKVVAVLFTMMRDALAAGIDTEKLQTATPAPLRQQLADCAKPPRRWPTFPMAPW
jgi:Tetracyclin repressor-like, C-terminal domain